MASYANSFAPTHACCWALHDAYARLLELRADAAATALPALAVVTRGVRLLYGAQEMLVEMPVLKGVRDAKHDEVMAAEPTFDTAAATITWLAARGLILLSCAARTRS
jgi:hypothetical protein